MLVSCPTTGDHPTKPGSTELSPGPCPSGLLRESGLSLQGNAKTLEGKQRPDRDVQFHYLNEPAHNHQDGGAPVISVDTQKKELVGPFKNNGRETSEKISRRLANFGTFLARRTGATPCRPL